MNKALLSAGLVLSALAAHSQITGFVLEPPALQRTIDFSWADWLNTPDITVPGYTIEGPAEFVTDGTASDSLGCNTLLNDLDGKFAVVYRGDCQFGTKALNAEIAGAIGVIIINTVGGPMGMAAGDDGDLVSIPTIMISNSVGNQLKDEIRAGNVEFLFGNLTGLFSQNLVLDAYAPLAPPSAGVVGLLAQDDNEFGVDLGSWIWNMGTASNTSARLHTVIEYNGNVLYEEESDPVTIAPGDSAWFTAPRFEQSAYPTGQYTVTYTALTDDEDEFPANNSISLSMRVGDIFSYAQPFADTDIPEATVYTASTPPANFTTCIHFNDANADRVAATGMYFSATTRAVENPFEDEVVKVSVLWWPNASDILDVLPEQQNLVELTEGYHEYRADERALPIYIPFDQAVALESGEHYLFCAQTYGDSILHGFNNHVSYYEHIINYETSPISLARNGNNWLWVAPDIAAALGVQMIDAATIGIAEIDRVDVTPYPNPANDIIRIPLKDVTGAAILEIFDQRGAKVSEQRVSVGGNEILTVNVSGISNGTYLFSMAFEDGRKANFRVVVSK